MRSLLAILSLCAALCFGPAHADPVCPTTPSPGTSNINCANTAFVQGAIAAALAGGGYVVGPATSTTGHVATFADGTGKVLEDGGAPATGTVTGPVSSTNNDFASFNGTGGTAIQDSGTPASFATGNVLANVSGSTGAPSATAPLALNQAGFTGMAGCGTHHPLANAAPASSGSVTQIAINALQYIVVCQVADYNSGIGWHPDHTALRLINLGTGPGSSADHNTVDITVHTGGGCTSPCVSTDGNVGGNDPDKPCAAQNTPTNCYLYVVGTTANGPGTTTSNQSWGLVLSSQGCNSGPGATVQAAYPYFACYFWNITTGAATYAGETFQFQLSKFNNKYQFAGGTGTGASGNGSPVQVTSGTQTQWTSLNLSGIISPNTLFVEFMLKNATANTICAIAPNVHMGGIPYYDNAGIATNGLWMPTGPLATDAGAFGVWSTSSTCAYYVTGFWDAF